MLSILGPVSFAISCWDGFQASLSQWFVRYISIYLWLPVSDLFSSVLARIQVLMLQRDIEQLSDPDFIPDSSNGVYITFLIIGIIGYFTIPTVSNWIVQAGGGAGNYGKNVNQAASKTGSVVAGTAGRRWETLPAGLSNNNSIKHLQNGIQIIEKYRDQLPTPASVRNRLSVCMHPACGIFRMEGLQAFAEAQREKIYVLDEGKSLMLALSQDLEQNRPVEAREHVRRFHELFFTLSPDKNAIEGNIRGGHVPQ